MSGLCQCGVETYQHGFADPRAVWRSMPSEDRERRERQVASAWDAMERGWDMNLHPELSRAIYDPVYLYLCHMLRGFTGPRLPHPTPRIAR